MKIKTRTSTHYQLQSSNGALWVAPLSHWSAMTSQIVAKANRYAELGFYDNDILCGDPIGAPSGAQLPTDSESEIEQARR